MRDADRVRTVGRYVLAQVPGWALAALLLAALARASLLGARTATAALFAWMAKDLLLYPLFRHAYEPGGASAAERLVNGEALARHGLNREGWVEVHGELWRAELAPGEEPVHPGHGVRGLTLLVTSAPPRP
jgi:membrane protein implicated in regulation of membrane protease activity